MGLGSFFGAANDRLEGGLSRVDDGLRFVPPDQVEGVATFLTPDNATEVAIDAALIPLGGPLAKGAGKLASKGVAKTGLGSTILKGGRRIGGKIIGRTADDAAEAGTKAARGTGVLGFAGRNPLLTTGGAAIGAESLSPGLVSDPIRDIFGAGGEAAGDIAGAGFEGFFGGLGGGLEDAGGGLFKGATKSVGSIVLFLVLVVVALVTLGIIANPIGGGD